MICHTSLEWSQFSPFRVYIHVSDIKSFPQDLLTWHQDALSVSFFSIKEENIRTKFPLLH